MALASKFRELVRRITTAARIVAHSPPHAPRAWALVPGPWKRVQAAYQSAFGPSILRDVMAAANEAELQPFLAFGTLLGQQREGDFIAHDRDLDFGVVTPAPDAIDAFRNAMAARGYRARFDHAGCLSLLHPRRGNVPADVYVFTPAPDGRLVCTAQDPATGEHFDYAFDDAVVRPLVPATFHSVAVWLPTNPAGFLVANYGDDWQTPRTTWDYRSDPESRIEVAHE